MVTPPERIHDPEEEESEYAIVHTHGASPPTPTLQKPAMLQDLVSCTITALGACPSGLKLFKTLISLPSLRHLALEGLQGGYGNEIDDLEVGVLHPQVKSLHIWGCQLHTNEASAIIKCCPSLSSLELRWYEQYEILHNPSSDQAKRLQFGEIADSIAQHTPNLSSLRLTAFEWPHRHFSSKYPYTIGGALQRLDRLESLKLDHHMIYGMQHLEELNDPHENNSGPRFTLSQMLPKNLTYLYIEASEFTAPVEMGEYGGDQPVDQWQDWQIDDLNQFLQDKSFERLSKVEVALGVEVSEDHIHSETVTEHGWEARMGGWARMYCELENKGRNGATDP